MKIISITKYTFTLLGICMLCGSAFLYKNTQAFLKEAILTKGIVVEYVRSGKNYASVIEFKTKEGVGIQFKSSDNGYPQAIPKANLLRFSILKIFLK